MSSLSFRLEARDLVLARRGVRVLDGVSVALSAQQIVSVEGPSGGGKTTLMRVLASMADPDSGTILVDGKDARTLPPRAYRTRIAYVLQQPPMLGGSVADNIATGPRLRGLSPPSSDIESLLDRVGLQGFGARSARELSGGEKARVAFARALANRPDALLLDEPTSALDPASATRVLDLVKSLAAGGLAVLVVTHNSEHAAALGGERLVLSAGRLGARGEGGATS